MYNGTQITPPINDIFFYFSDDMPKICILEENETFERRKCAYFLRNMSEKGSFKHFFILFSPATVFFVLWLAN
jgi:hypothetical protein